MKKVDFNSIDFIQKRNIKYSRDYDDTFRKEYGEYCLENGNLTDAIDLFSSLNNTGKLEDIKQSVIANGDYFHYKLIHKLQKTDMNDKEINLLMENAISNGYSRYAQEARQYLESLNSMEKSEDDKENAGKKKTLSKKKRQ